MSDEKRDVQQAVGAFVFLDLIKEKLGTVVTGTLRGNKQMVELARQEAHDLVDHMIDMEISGIVAIQERVKRETDGI